jgi:hypothetical protein
MARQLNPVFVTLTTLLTVLTLAQSTAQTQAPGGSERRYRSQCSHQLAMIGSISSWAF